MIEMLFRAARRKAALVSAGALVLIMAGTAVAGSGIGGVFNLGRTNTVNYVTTLVGSYASRLLQVTNTSTSSAAVGAQIRASYGTPLQLIGSTSKPPFTTNSAVKVPYLNADRLDYLDSTQFQRANAAAGGDLTGAYPGPSIAANAVGSEEVTDESLTQDDIGDNQIWGGVGAACPTCAGVHDHIKDGTVVGSDLAPRTVGTNQLANGSVTSTELAGGAVRTSDMGTLTIRTAGVLVPGAGSVEGNGAYESRSVFAFCSPFEVAISGGAFWDSAADDKEQPILAAYLANNQGAYSAGTAFPQRFYVRGGNDTNADHTLYAQVLCLAP
jgi:hypothetical protein